MTICGRLAPTAMRTPISLVRSVTDTSKIFMIPDPTDQQGHGGNGKQHHRQGLTGAFLNLPDIDLSPDCKIILLLRLNPMARP